VEQGGTKGGQALLIAVSLHYPRALAALETAEPILEKGAVHRPSSLLAALAYQLQGDIERENR